MTEKIKSQLTTAYMMFIFDFHDPLDTDQKALEAKMPCPLVDLFKTQRIADKSKRRLEEDFNKALCLYFKRFQTIDGVDVLALQLSMDQNEKVMRRHIGKDKMVHLRLIVNLIRSLGEKPKVKKGLLSEQAA